ncbi:hypothetical protein N184_36830 [Sinorhizobium sp. GL28]|nr:hypothetical protein N184_36830 [Sinorhizobium sp. GL28]
MAEAGQRQGRQSAYQSLITDVLQFRLHLASPIRDIVLRNERLDASKALTADIKLRPFRRRNSTA